MKCFLRFLAVLYLIGGLLHLADVFDLRLLLSEMTTTWKVWVWSLLLADFAAAVGLWKETSWGIALFLIIAGAQLIAYLGFQKVFGPQRELVVFHIATLLIFSMLSVYKQMFLVKTES